MTSASSVADAATELAKTFTGQSLQPADPGHYDVRKVHNALVNKPLTKREIARTIRQVLDE